MKTKFGLLILALALSTVLAANCPPVTFGQIATDWYTGSTPIGLTSYYLVQGSPQSTVGACHPLNQYVFSWKDGFYLWGMYGGNSISQCPGVSCPSPANHPDARMIFVAGAPGSVATRFLVDSVRWQNQGVTMFNFDHSAGITHAMGSLAPPKVSAHDSIRGVTTARVDVPLPAFGFYSDASKDPALLIAGIAILCVTSDAPPSTLSAEQFTVLAAFPIDLRQYTGQAFATVSKEVRVISENRGTNYFSYTLIINDGSGRPLEALPTLPFGSPVVTAESGPTHRTLDGRLGDLTPSAASYLTDTPKLAYVTAIDRTNFVELEWQISGTADGTRVRVLRSADLMNWEDVPAGDPSLIVENGTASYLMLDESVRPRSSMGVFYEIQIVDATSGQIVGSARTRAR